VKKKGERTVTEGCLSIPGYIGQITRAESVTAKAQDINGKAIRIKAEELLAQALEHEIDHLDGVLYVDHLESPDDLRKIETEEMEL
jgi:peptide deformylase